MKKVLAILLSVCLVFVSIGCGSTSTAEQSDSSQAQADSSESSTESQPESAEPVKVALCVSSIVNDGGWCQVAYEGLLKAEEELGCEIAYAENCEVSDIEAIFSDYAAQGYDLIIGHGFQFNDPALVVGEKYPDTHFAIIEGSTASANVAPYNIGTHELSYVLGILAARMTKTGKIGAVYGIEGPSLVKCAEAYKLGARTVDENIDIKIAYIGSFDDAALAKEAALAMADDGCDIILSGCNSAETGVIKAAEEKGIYCFGETVDMNDMAPDTVITSDIFNFTTLVYQACLDEVNGKFEGVYRQVGLKENPEIEQLAPYHGFEEIIPDEVKKEVEDTLAQIESGELVVPVIETPTED